MDRAKAEKWIIYCSVICYFYSFVMLIFGIYILTSAFGPSAAPLQQVILVMMGLVFIGLCALYFFIGRGLLLYQEWARLTNLVLAWLSGATVVFQVVGTVIYLMFPENRVQDNTFFIILSIVMVFGLCSLALSIMPILVLQFNGTVKELFAAQTKGSATASPTLAAADPLPNDAKPAQRK